jgi:hypothetical protein
MRILNLLIILGQLKMNEEHDLDDRRLSELDFLASVDDLLIQISEHEKKTQALRTRLIKTMQDMTLEFGKLEYGK